MDKQAYSASHARRGRLGVFFLCNGAVTTTDLWADCKGVHLPFAGDSERTWLVPWTCCLEELPALTPKQAIQFRQPELVRILENHASVTASVTMKYSEAKKSTESEKSIEVQPELSGISESDLSSSLEPPIDATIVNI